MARTVRELVVEIDAIFFGTGDSRVYHHTEVLWNLKKKLFDISYRYHKEKSALGQVCADTNTDTPLTEGQYQSFLKEAHWLKTRTSN